MYRPPQELVDHVVARDRRCRFPNCRRRAMRCDVDHQRAWEDFGRTDACKLECLCPRHHALKHEAGWTVRGDPAGVLTWTAPTGHTYLDPPGEHPIDVTFSAADDDDHDDHGLVQDDNVGQDIVSSAQDDDRGETGTGAAA